MNIDAARILISDVLRVTEYQDRTSADSPIPDFYAERVTRSLLAAIEYLRPDELPEIKTCIDITAEKLERYVEGQAPWDPRGELMFFKHKETPLRVMWLSRYRIGIHALSVDGVGVTKGDKYRLSLRNRHEGRKEHRRWNATKAAQAGVRYETEKANPKA